MRSLYFVILFLFSLILQGQTDLEKSLFLLDDVIFTKVDTPEGYEAAYKLMIRQPLDHTNPDKGYFYQKAYLSHRDNEAPTVIITEGYNRNSNRIYELTELIDGNQIDVEHRFYGESIPDSMQYQYLNLEQATADLHRINQLFKQIYDGKWLSTGISKGGQTTIFYRYFFPDDVDVSVPYVAPLNIELEETRIYDFLDTIGTEECRKKIYDVQYKILKSREQSLQMMKWYAKGANLDFEYLTFEEAFEYAVLEYPFSFWQWGGKCEDIPDASADLEEMLDHFTNISDIGFFSDRDMTAYASHYYQAGSQMGYYSYETEEFKDLLKSLPSDSNPTAVFMPDKMEINFDNSLPIKVDAWIKEHGDEFIYINGANDTWSATSVKPNKERKAVWFNLVGKDHGQARIKNMTKAEKRLLEDTLEEWLEIEIGDK